jgi:hypothetical protein
MSHFLACIMLGGILVLPLDITLGATCIGFVMVAISALGGRIQ